MQLLRRGGRGSKTGCEGVLAALAANICTAKSFGPGAWSSLQPARRSLSVCDQVLCCAADLRNAQHSAEMECGTDEHPALCERQSLHAPTGCLHTQSELTG